ncbi:hypothetical protein QJS04_geneDACA024034 [Acorus gramineus]|uniref:GRF-type domain-containing protein n=1 Tax=Acorus gramineus TaxID=55184 RepID=A0AAV8ZYG1_ACOGR|nr:hypothetical protein QJS04_geneDACA024034 [Acorus gramineus]
MGRRFFRCPAWREENDCEFFEWLDNANHTTIDLKYQIIAVEERINQKMDAMILHMEKSISLIKLAFYLFMIMIFTVLYYMMK